MSRRKVGLILGLSLPFLAVGCGATSGFLRDSMTQTQIQGAGFRIVKTGLAASVQTGSVFCTIPTDDGQLYRQAMEQLNAQARLTPNQMLVNIREDMKTMAILIFYCKWTLTLSADIIEFSGRPPAPPPPEVKPPPAEPPPPPPPVDMAPPVPPPAVPGTAPARPTHHPR